MLRAPLLVCLSVLVSACSGKDPYNPGTALGTFNVEGKLRSNACGDSSGAGNPWDFSVKLAKDPGVLYWIQGDQPVSGPLDQNQHTSMQSSDTRTVHQADTRSGLGFCAMTRADSLDATLSGTPPSAFSGTLVYAFSQTDGSDCSDQLASFGGPYNALPCTVGYDLTGTLAPK